MKRDNDLLRSILLEAEESGDYYIQTLLHLSMSEEENRRHHHIQILVDDGLMCEIVSGGNVRLTSKGHDFVEAIRDEGIWQDTKEVVLQAGGNATIDIIKEISVGFLKKKIQVHTGVEI